MFQTIPTRTDAPGSDELEQFAQNLGPFEPPPSYRFEPEFTGPPPRSIPSELYTGRYCRKRKLGIIGLFVAGLMLLACRLIPIVQIWGLYVLPFQYLHWIGAALLLGSGAGWIQYTFGRGPFVYVDDGTPLVARIVALFLRAKLIVNGVPSVFQYVAMFQHRDPETGELVFSSDTYDVKATVKDEVALSYHIGDYVTAVYLRSNPSKSLRLYGFLDLRPNLGIIPLVKTHEWTVVQLIGAIGAIAGFFFILGWNVYAYGKFKPLEMSLQEHAVPFVIGAVLLGGGLLGGLAWGARRARKKLEKNNQEAVADGGAVELPWQPKRGLFGQGPIMSVVLLFGGALLGGLTMLCWAFTMNAICDSSLAVRRPALIRNMWMKTHNFLFREYTIEYNFADDPDKKKQELLTTPSHMASFGPIPVGSAQVRQGFFGWPWVETITPLAQNGDGKEKE